MYGSLRRPNIYFINNVQEHFMLLTHVFAPSVQEYTPGKHKCDKCNKTFTGRHTLRRHRRTVHVPRRFKCNGCAMMFKTRSNLNRHQSKSREHCILLSKSSPLTRQEDSSKVSKSTKCQFCILFSIKLL